MLPHLSAKSKMMLIIYMPTTDQPAPYDHENETSSSINLLVYTANPINIIKPTEKRNKIIYQININ